MHKQQLVIICAVLVSCTLVGGYLYTQNQKSTDSTLPSSNYVINREAFAALSGGIPDLQKEVLVRSTYTGSAKTELISKIDSTRSRLKKDSERVDDWFTLGLLYHDAGDYDKVREVWEFLAKVITGPPSSVVYDNLGKLYHFDLHDFPKAEEYFLKSAAANPSLSTPYLELFDLYRYSYKKDTSAAVDSMKVAMDKFPNDSGIPAGLGVYYRDLGKFALARTYLEKALTIARTNNDLNQVQNLTRELSSLP